MRKLLIIVMAALLALAAGACSVSGEAPVQSPAAPEDNTTIETEVEHMDNTYEKREGIEVIYLAGGCFWGMEKLMQTLPGVVEATSGYANGNCADPTYEQVCSGSTEFRETVRVEYEPDKVSLDMILFTFFTAIDPTIENRQGNDTGSQYQSGIYWADEASRETALRIAAIEAERYEPFAVETGPLINFYDAEEYHQDYLDRNPGGYCHITQHEFSLAENAVFDPGDYPRPSADEIKEKLTEGQYYVTQEAGTEAPFGNEYWDNHEDGLYVDVVTGEPMFSSADKFDSGTGWPSFSQGIDESALILLTDNSLGTERTEVRSRAGNSHLGHVFYGESGSPTGVRFCINSAALRFIPYGDMDAEGYGYLKEYVK